MFEFTTRRTKDGNPTVVPLQPLNYPPRDEFESSLGLGIAPAPPSTPNKSIQIDPSLIPPPDEAIGRRRMILTARQMVNRMKIIEAFSDSLSRSFRPHSDTQKKIPPSTEDTFSHYVTVPFSFEIIADPTATKYTWVQRSVNLLFYFWIADIILSAFLLAITLFALVFLTELYAKELLRIIFMDSSYVTMYGFIVTHAFVILLGITFLCYPSKSSWGRFHKLRWILMAIPNIVLVVGVLDQTYWIANFQEIGHLLKETMEPGLDVTKNTILTVNSQPFYGCCGVHGHKDWMKIIKNKESIYYGGFPKSCCSDKYIKSCSIPVTEIIPMDPTGINFTQLWDSGCYNYELALVESVAIITWLIIIPMTIATILASVYVWWVVRHVNIHDLIINHPFLED